MSDQDVINVVDPIAKSYGVPTLIWETVAEVESGLNPKAVGDNGSSFGLFQLHRGGQLGNLTEQQAFDPATNARTAMPAIAQAWKTLNNGVGAPSTLNGQQNAGSYAWWYNFAVLSGHPGRDSGAADSPTKQEATRLQNEASYLLADPLPSSSSGGTPTQRGDYGATDPVCAPINPFTWGTCIAQVGPKIGIFVLALLGIIVGIWAVSGASNGHKGGK